MKNTLVHPKGFTLDLGVSTIRVSGAKGSLQLAAASADVNASW